MNTPYRDANGNFWATAQEALDEFLLELPDLTDEETELVFQFTNHSESAEFNLNAIDFGIVYGGFTDKFGGSNYPVPFPAKFD
jgi:hypothetical protein